MNRNVSVNHAQLMSYRPCAALQLIDITHPLLRILHWPPLTAFPAVEGVAKTEVYLGLPTQPNQPPFTKPAFANYFLLSTNNTSLVASGRYCLIWFDPVWLRLLALFQFFSRAKEFKGSAVDLYPCPLIYTQFRDFRDQCDQCFAIKKYVHN